MVTEEIIRKAILKRLAAGQTLFAEIGRWQKPSCAWFDGKPVTFSRVAQMHQEGLIDYLGEHSLFIGMYTISAKGRRFLEEIEDGIQNGRETSNSSIQ